MLYRPPVMFVQKVGASGASGMIAPMPTTAMGSGVNCVMTVIPSKPVSVRLASGQAKGR